ncbi:MAG TPA: radical SAM protein [Thermodesulfobacteriota bacterium]|nr:radical SAM protein [Thermodesulfobacteriota bacterium]
MEADFFIQWHITNKCNLRCRHCYQEEFTEISDAGWPGLKEIADTIVATMEKWGRRACINITGGEPLLKPETFHLLGDLDVRERVAETGLITNGLLLDGRASEKLASFRKLKEIKISVDGGDPGTNDRIRAPGSFERVVDNISRVVRDGRFDIVLMFTAMQGNYGTLVPLIRLALELGVQGLIIERFIPWGRGKAMGEQVLEREHWKEMTDTLFDFFDIDAGDEGLAAFQAFEVDLRNGEPELKGAPCVLGKDGICVMPDGTVFPCRRLPVPIGNLRREPLEVIWEESPVLRRVTDRKNIAGRCGLCRVEGCLGCRSLAYSLTGDFLAEDPHCRLNNS